MRKNNPSEKDKRLPAEKSENIKKEKPDKTVVKNANAAGQGAMYRGGEELDKGKQQQISY